MNVDSTKAHSTNTNLNMNMKQLSQMGEFLLNGRTLWHIWARLRSAGPDLCLDIICCTFDRQFYIERKSGLLSLLTSFEETDVRRLVNKRVSDLHNSNGHWLRLLNIICLLLWTIMISYIEYPMICNMRFSNVY